MYSLFFLQLQIIETVVLSMSRSIPWRNKPSQLILQMIPVANQYKLYLVHETGPTSFVFKDDNDNKFKVTIGFTIMCSCGVVQNDHCIHTLFVMLKKFKVPENNPILWQASYLDSELQGLVQLKYAQKKKQINKKKFQYKKSNQLNPQFKDDVQDFPPLGEDQMCPICYEQMNSECYSTCKTCHKSLHTKCFKVWTRHKQDSGVAVTCPMCRAAFVNPMTIIFKDIQKWQNRFSTHKGTFCKGCAMKNIRGLLYKCLVCSGVQLCKMCFEGNQHADHDRYFVKSMVGQPWKIAPTRIKKSKKQLFQPIKETNYKDLSNIESEEFLVDLFPTLKQYNSCQTVTELGIVGNQILVKQICMKCKTIGNELMRRLSCGHGVHDQCLISMISKKNFICDLDNIPMFPGYMEAMGIKIAKTKKTVQSVLLKNQEEITQINEHLNQLQINGFIPRTKPTEKRVNSLGTGNLASKSKDKNFRIMKKTLNQRQKNQQTYGAGNLGMIMITGFGHPNINPHSNNVISIPNHQLPPKMKHNLNQGGVLR